MNFQTVEELMASPGIDPDPTKRSDPEHCEPDPDLDDADAEHDDRAISDLVTPQGLTSDGYALLAEMDFRGEFV